MLESSWHCRVNDQFSGAHVHRAGCQSVGPLGRRSVLRPCLRLPWWGIGSRFFGGLATDCVYWTAARARPLHLAASHRRRRLAHGSTTFDPARRHRLAVSGTHAAPTISIVNIAIAAHTLRHAHAHRSSQRHYRSQSHAARAGIGTSVERDRRRELREQVSTNALEIEHLKLLIAKLKRIQSGRKSEELGHEILQLELLLEELQADEEGRHIEQPPRQIPRVFAKRAPLPSDLSRDVQFHLPVDATECSVRCHHEAAWRRHVRQKM